MTVAVGVPEYCRADQYAVKYTKQGHMCVAGSWLDALQI